MKFKLNKNKKGQVTGIDHLKNVEMTEKGLKCDNVDCDFKDESIKSIDYEKSINKPCPKCGENLLTKQDFINVRTLEMVVQMTNSMTKEEIDSLNLPLKGKVPDFLANIENPENKRISIEIDTHKKISLKNAKALE